MGQEQVTNSDKVYIRTNDGKEYYKTPKEVLPDRKSTIEGRTILYETLNYSNIRNLRIKELIFPDNFDYTEYNKNLYTRVTSDLWEPVANMKTILTLCIDHFFELDNGLKVPEGIEMLTVWKTRIRGQLTLSSTIKHFRCIWSIIEEPFDIPLNGPMDPIHEIRYNGYVPPINNPKEVMGSNVNRGGYSIYLQEDPNGFLVKVNLSKGEKKNERDYLLDFERLIDTGGVFDDTDLIDEKLFFDLNEVTSTLKCLMVRTTSKEHYQEHLHYILRYLEEKNVAVKDDNIWLDIKPLLLDDGKTTDATSNDIDVFTPPDRVKNLSIRNLGIHKAIMYDGIKFINISNCGLEELELGDQHKNVYCSNNKLDSVRGPLKADRFVCDHYTHIENFEKMREAGVDIHMVDPSQNTFRL